MRRALPIRLGKAISAFCFALRHSAHPGAAFFVVFSFLALVILGAWGTAVGIQTAWDIHREFRAMTPADHLRGADAASAIRDYERALQHLSAIPPEAPEFSKAAILREEIAAAKDAGRKQQLAAQEIAEQAGQQRASVVQDLQASLTRYTIGYTAFKARLRVRTYCVPL
jgi:hypothetical protein